MRASLETNRFQVALSPFAFRFSDTTSATPEEKIELAGQAKTTVDVRAGNYVRGLKVVWESSREGSFDPRESMLDQGQITDDTLIFTGRTATYYNKQLATHAALDESKGVYPITNEIEII